MAVSVSKSMSLVEQKKLQWAREREEMAGLCAPWGPRSQPESSDALRSSVRTHFVSNMELNQVNTDSLSGKLLPRSCSESLGRVRRRSPSLPPIYTRNIHNAQEDEDNTQTHEQEDEGETETSGYASESGGNEIRQPGDYWQQHQASSWVSEQSHLRHDQHTGSRRSLLYNRGYVTPDSVISTPSQRWSYVGTDESNRPRWGDRGVGVGHLWEPTFHEPDCRLPQVQGSDRDTPSWLERGLNKLGDSQVLVINHRPDPGSNVTCGLANSSDISSVNAQIHTDCGRTYLRGQNVPLEPDVLLERERKRQKALEIQNAIRQQLEERDRKRKEERERRAKEEREEEERIKMERAREKQKLEEEIFRQREREEKEARKAKAMREALENAQKLAQQEKIRARTKYNTPAEQQDAIIKHNGTSSNSMENVSTHEPQYQIHTPDVIEEQMHSLSKPCEKIEPQIAEFQDNMFASYTGKLARNATLLPDTLTMPADGVALVLGPAQPADRALPSNEMIPAHTGGVQLALLMSPSALAGSALAGSALAGSALAGSALAGSALAGSQIVEERLLTPTRFRHYARGTQTDTGLFVSSRKSRSKVKYDCSKNAKERKESASLDRPHRGCKLPLRCRSQSQPNQPRLSIEERPKWGVNRPPTQYVKQSERDPYYQRRMRQRLLRAALLTGSSGGGGFLGTSADTGTESDTGSHRRTRRTRRDSTERNSRSPSPLEASVISSHKSTHYQHQQFSERISNEKPDVSVISLDLSALDCMENHNSERKKKNASKNRNFQIGSPNKRVQVLSYLQNNIQRFPGNSSKNKSNELFSNSFSITSKNYNNRGFSDRSFQSKQQQVTLDLKNNVDNWTSQDILSQLTSLRQGLLIKQQEWEKKRNQAPHKESFW